VSGWVSTEAMMVAGILEPIYDRQGRLMLYRILDRAAYRRWLRTATEEP
jgi:hypothetical protein